MFKICISKNDGEKTSLMEKNSPMEKKRRKDSFEKCDHFSLVRAFSCGSAIIKFSVTKQEKYEINWIDLRCEESKRLYTANKNKKVVSWRQAEVDEKKQCLGLIKIELQKIPFFTNNSNSSMILSNMSPKAMANYENFISLSDVIAQVEAQIATTETSEEESTDETLFMFRIHQIEMVLKQSIEIMNYISNSVKKEKF